MVRFCCLLSFLVLIGYDIGRASTLDTVRKNDFIQCGVSQGLPGFSSPDDKSNWKGLDVDFCKAMAAAILGDATKVKYRPLSAKERFTALQSGEIDVLSRNTTWTLTRDTSLGMDFIGPIYYDGQGFMVRKAKNITRAKQLNGATVCVNTGTTTELNLADYFRAQKMKYKIVAFEKTDEVLAAYDAGRCDAYTTDQSGLFSERNKLKVPNDHLILPDVISKEPLGPAVRHGDNQWGDIARWTLFAMLEAEELGVTSANVDESKKDPNPSIRRLLGLEGDMGKALGVSNEWVFNIIKQVGNYGEVFERNLGAATPLKIARGQNALWKNGGLQYAMPIR